jgi:PAS domain-containing protein
MSVRSTDRNVALHPVSGRVAGGWSGGFRSADLVRPADSGRWFEKHMSDTSKRRHDRNWSTSARFKPSRPVPAEQVRPSPIGMAGLAACGAVIIVAITLSLLIWIVTARTVQDQRVEIRERAEQTLQGLASTMAETVGHELLLIDQSLTIIQAAWKSDSDTVDLISWQAGLPALTAVADDLFIADEKHIIRQDILPKAVGQGVGAAYVTFPHGSLEQFGSDGSRTKDAVLLQGQTGPSLDARQFLMYIIRPLDHPKGWLVGASFRSTELTKLFAQAALGINPVVALVDTKRGVVQAVVGPAARRPKTDLSQTPLFASITRSPSGTWLGDTGIDDVQRIHAFHRVADRDMVVVVAANYSEVMAFSDDLASGARSVASVATIVVVFVAVLVLWQLYNLGGHRRQQRIFDRNRTELERLRGNESANTAQAHLNAVRLRIVLDSAGDGVAVFDASLRLIQWNHPFLRGIGIEPRQNMALDVMLREQAAKGMFGAVTDVEAEIGRRAGVLRTGDPVGLAQPGPHRAKLTLRSVPTGEGGFVLLLAGPATSSSSYQAMQVDAPEPRSVTSPAVDW